MGSCQHVVPIISASLRDNAHTSAPLARYQSGQVSVEQVQVGQQRHVGEMDTESVEAVAVEVKMTETVNKMNAVMKKAPKTTCIDERRPLAPEHGARWFIALRNRAARARGSGGVDLFPVNAPFLCWWSWDR